MTRLSLKWPLAILVVLTTVVALPAQTSQPDAGNAVTPLELEGLLSAVTTVNGDSFAREWTTALTRRSPTFREMLGVLRRTPHMRVTLLSRPDLKRATRLAARGTFTTHDGKIYGLLEFDRSQLNPLLQLQMIVHEIAHAVEIACLPPADEADDLRRQLSERKGAYHRGVLEAIETPFPDAVVRVVIREYNAQSDAGKLRALAADFGLNLPAAEAVADTSK